MNSYVYTYRANEFQQIQLPNGIHYGLIADEVRSIMPGIVKKAIHLAEYENHIEPRGKKLSDPVEFKAINYTELIPILIAGMKEQQTTIERQQQQIDQLLKEIELIKAKLK